MQSINLENNNEIRKLSAETLENALVLHEYAVRAYAKATHKFASVAFDILEQTSQKLVNKYGYDWDEIDAIEAEIFATC